MHVGHKETAATAAIMVITGGSASLIDPAGGPLWWSEG